MMYIISFMYRLYPYMNSDIGSILYPVISVIREREFIALLRKYYGRRTIKRYQNSTRYCLDKIFILESQCMLNETISRILANDLQIIAHCDAMVKDPNINVIRYTLENAMLKHRSKSVYGINIYNDIKVEQPIILPGNNAKPSEITIAGISACIHYTEK